MLRYLTHKLRTQSLNESDAYPAKTDDDRDSGTESDDEGADIEELQKYMESIIHVERVPQRRCRRQLPASVQVTTEVRHRPQSESPALDSALPSDSDPLDHGHSSEEELEVINSHSSSPRLQKRKWGCPVEFRTSPPAHAHKPSKCLRGADIPPHELCAASPRKRHRRTATGHTVQRPCLDFEKMQQINRVLL